MKILGIETSCDETAAALIEIQNSCLRAVAKVALVRRRTAGKAKFEILSNIVLSQVEIHKQYGGIVPEVAARKHMEGINLVIQEALGNLKKPDLIAVTYGPGLITSLQVGVQAAKTLSYVWGVPLIGVNHLEGHLWSFLLNKELGLKIEPACLAMQSIAGRNLKLNENWKLEIGNYLPAIALIVSGGHTELILVKGIGKYKLIGQTRDDAAGEAFDKVAKMLGLGYPGGPIISHFALEGNRERIKFPRPMLESNDFDFSFSGLKTAVKYHLQEMLPTGNLSQAFINDICASFQAAVIEVLATKTIKAAEKFKAKSVILGGGVSANELLINNLGLRLALSEARQNSERVWAGEAEGSKDLGIEFYYPEKEYTQDNAAMIALAGYFNYKKVYPPNGRAGKTNWRTLDAEANLRLT